MGVTDRPLGRRALGGQSVANRGKVAPVRVFSYPAGTHTFTAPVGGWYRFVMWGAGAGYGSGSGAFVQAERALAGGQRVAIVVAYCDGNFPSMDTTATLPSGEVLRAGSPTATNGPGGAAAAGAQDIAINGSKGYDGSAPVAGGGDNGGSAGSGQGGAGAPGWGGHKGGKGGDQTSPPAGIGGAPGGGGGVGVGNQGAPGAVLVYQVRLKP